MEPERVKTHKDLLAEVKDVAADGLDPGDALTAEEALARVLVLLNGSTIAEGYETRQIQMLMEWERGGKHLRPEIEAAGLVRAWS